MATDPSERKPILRSTGHRVKRWPYSFLVVVSMPKRMERALKRAARKKGLKGKRRGAYIYGTMRKMGWKPKSRKSAGRRR